MPKRNLIWTIAIIAAAAAVVLLTRTPPKPDDPDQARFGPVVRAYRTIRDHYGGPVSDSALRRGAVRGMVEQLDEYSSYVPPERIDAFNARLDGHVTGTGLRVEAVDGAVRIAGALAGSPAQRADIAPGSRIVAIGPRPVADLPIRRVHELLEGPAGTTVQITTVDDEGGEHVHKIARRRFHVETVLGLGRTGNGRWDFLADGKARVAYMRITEFVPDTVGRLQRALRELSGARGLVLDLRDNPGGRIEAGFAVANLFLRSGLIFTKLDASGEAQSFRAHAGGTCPPVPMVVLINGRTASAAEIVAGSLRLHDRAVLVGTRTRGKGLVQSLIALGDDLGQVNLTTSEFLIGKDIPITRRSGKDAWGVDPHREVALTPAQEASLRHRWAEVELAPTRAGHPATAPATAPASAPVTQPADPRLAADPQLALAVELLETDGAMEAILAEAAAERKARQAALATQPASTQPAATQPDANCDE